MSEETPSTQPAPEEKEPEKKEPEEKEPKKESASKKKLPKIPPGFLGSPTGIILLILLGISAVLDWIPLVGQFLSLPFKVFYFILFYTTFKPSLLKEIITPLIIDNIPILNILPWSLIFFLRFLGLLPKGPF